MKKLVLVVAIMALAGCSTVYPVGSIGDHNVYHAVTRDLFAPCTSTIFTLGPDKTLMKVDGGVGPSIFGQFAGPAAVTAAGIYIGKGLEESGDRTTENTTVEGSRAGAIQGQVQGQAQGQLQGQGQGQGQAQSLF